MTQDELLRLIDQAAEEGWKELDLAGKDIEELPSEIGKLTELESLVLGKLDQTTYRIIGNQLSALPPEIVQLTNLQSLDLSSNQLSALPPEIVQLTKLEEFDLRGNPIPIPPEILGPKEFYKDPGSLPEILDFYFQTLDPDASEPLYEAKFLIIG
ncbi:hypothetical protein C7271_26850, partial [filamentous cyanobacterium CCP5]